MITEEKNKYVKLRQIASQTAAELTEQVKVHENESEIQRGIVISKDRCVEGLFLFICLTVIDTDAGREAQTSTLKHCNSLATHAFVSSHCHFPDFPLPTRSLAKARMKISSSSRKRDKLRNDISKVHTRTRTHSKKSLWE